ncbi:MAG: hypothetical protein Q8P97_02150, partial [bacterium]|nr:hypothetical protein [bacterium]
MQTSIKGDAGMDSFEAMELGRKLPEQAYTNAVKLRELLTEIVDLRGKIMEWALGAALLATAFLLLALLSGVQLFGGLFNPKTYEAIIRVADFPAACRGSLVGRFGNPRFPNKTCGGASDHTLRLAAGWLIYP